MPPLSKVVFVCVNSAYWEPRILTEYMDDLDFPKPRHFSIRNWVDRGMLLLDPVHMPGTYGKPLAPLKIYQTVRNLSHQGGYVFVLYGKFAEDYAGAVDTDTNLVVTQGNHPFSRASDYLGIDRQTMWRQ